MKTTNFRCKKSLYFGRLLETEAGLFLKGEKKYGDSQWQEKKGT